MKRNSHVLAFLVLSLCYIAFPARAQDADDPFLWLEEVDGESALAWVEAHNAVSTAQLESHPEFDKLLEQNLAIYNSDDRIAYTSFMGPHLYNFWQDDVNERGLWRRTTVESYLTASPEWEVVLDVDALAAAENENWVYKGSTCLYPDYHRCMLRLSRGGGDAVVIREFDTTTKAFVEGGFSLPEAKGSVSWKDENRLYVSTDFGPESTTTSGYPKATRLWSRGVPLEEAELVFEGDETDVGVWSYVLHAPEGEHDLIRKSTTFYTGNYYLRRDGASMLIDIPADASLVDIFKGQLIVELKTDWTPANERYPQGSLISIDVDAFLDGDRDFRVVVTPNERSSISSVSTTRNFLLVNMLNNVRSELFQFRFDDGYWRRENVETPEFGNISVTSADDLSDLYFFSYNGFLTPNSLYLVSEGGNSVERVKTLPAFFESANLTVEQMEVASKDGTHIPYFVVRSKDLAFDASAPTLLYGYGGFEVAMRPSYSASVGASWLERGGVYVLANIRGGGEFGPSWHQSALKENRQRAYDDFIAVAEDLVKRRITEPKYLGIMGGSNGGLLVGAAVTQRPDLFGAVVCRVPLLDMKRYNKLLAGASWMAEYGDPDVPEEWEYIRRFSPYHNVREDASYPKIFFSTSTRDDRVHPGHARKMVAKMESMGHEVYYYENTEGGHAAATNNYQRAYANALIYAYLLEQLVDSGPTAESD